MSCSYLAALGNQQRRERPALPLRRRRFEAADSCSLPLAVRPGLTQRSPIIPAGGPPRDRKAPASRQELLLVTRLGSAPQPSKSRIAAMGAFAFCVRRRTSDN